MTITLAIPFFNQLNDVKGSVGLLKYNTHPSTEWLVIDNGSTDPVEEFITRTVKPKRLNYLRNEENIGMVATYNQIFSLATTDLVAILHNDVFVFEKDWDQRVVRSFESLDKLGALGFFGAQGVGPIGERIQDPEYPGQMAGISNMLEGAKHGLLLREPYRACAILDGFAMVFNTEMIKKAGGLDQKYLYHHLYDRDLPLTSLSLGYKNIVLNVPCHHQSGVTANRAEYQTWINQKLNRTEGADVWTHDENSKVFAKKWKNSLPLYVESDFSFRKGQFGGWNFKGDHINTSHRQKITP